MTELLVALGLIAGVVAAHELGFWLGSLIRSADEPFDRQIALVRTSTAALVAFLIGFAFSGAASRFIERLDIVVKEANALGTAYLRADAIAEPQRGELKAALREYTADRVQLLSGEKRDQIEPLLAKVSGLHERMWRPAIRATQDNAPLMAVVLPPINEVIDASRYGEKTLAPSAHGGAFGDGGNRRWPAGLRQWSSGAPVFSARLRLRGGSCGRSVDDYRPGLSWHRHYWVEQSQSRGNLSCYEVSVMAWCKPRPNTKLVINLQTANLLDLAVPPTFSPAPITVNPADKGALRLCTSDATVAFTGPGPSSPLAGIGGMSPSPAGSSKRGDYP